MSKSVSSLLAVREAAADVFLAGVAKNIRLRQDYAGQGHSASSLGGRQYAPPWESCLDLSLCIRGVPECPSGLAACS